MQFRVQLFQKNANIIWQGYPGTFREGLFLTHSLTQVTTAQ